MTKGLITRIGEWLDRKWEAKATERDLIERTERLERLIKERVTEADMETHGKALAQTIKQTMEALQRCAVVEQEALALKELLKSSPDGERLNKDFADLKKRMEQLELYVGMKRKIDPTREPVAKSAFSM